METRRKIRLHQLKTKLERKVNVSVKAMARAVRWVIWGLSVIAVGAIKPMFFPEGGASYAITALLLLAVCAALGIVVERWLLARTKGN